MRRITKKVNRKFIELTPAEMAHEMYLASPQEGWDISTDGSMTTVRCDPDLITINEKTGTVCFELVDQDVED